MLRFLLLHALAVLPALATDNPLHDQITDLFKQRQWAQAQALLEKTTNAEPTNAEAWHYLGQTYLNLGNAEESVAALEKAAALAPTNSEYQRFLGDAYGLSAQKAGMFSKFSYAKKCKAAYDKAVVLDPKSINARWSVMEYCRQAPGIVGGGMESAYAQAEEIKKLDADRGRIAFAMLYAADKKFAEAFALFDEALRANPDDYAALYQLGRLAAMSGERLDDGLLNLRKCLGLTRPPSQPGPGPVHWRIGQILEKKNDIPSAKAAYEAAVAADPKFVQAAESLRKLTAR